MSNEKLDIERLFYLAGLSPDETEYLSLTRDIEEMISFADRLRQAGDNASPVFFPHCEKNALREDIPTDSLCRGKLLSSSKNTCDGYFSVPRVVGEEDC